MECLPMTSPSTAATSAARRVSPRSPGPGRAPRIGRLDLWYRQPAAQWVEALPLGNGRLGAMVFGDPARERLQLNEDSFWSGGPSRNDNPDALGALAGVRQAIFEGRYTDAESMINQSMTAGSSTARCTSRSAS